MFSCIFTCSSVSSVPKGLCHYAVNVCHARVIHVILTCALNNECTDTAGYWLGGLPPGSGGRSSSLGASSSLHTTVKTTSCSQQEVSHHLLHSRELDQYDCDNAVDVTCAHLGLTL